MSQSATEDDLDGEWGFVDTESPSSSGKPSPTRHGIDIGGATDSPEIADVNGSNNLSGQPDGKLLGVSKLQPRQQYTQGQGMISKNAVTGNSNGNGFPMMKKSIPSSPSFNELSTAIGLALKLNDGDSNNDYFLQFPQIILQLINCS